ncbi:MAG TPA: hypothetical protein VM144_15885 [Aestuariivirga sp.]|nr:hypothetical protein [Aestuariivirga sp.]
MSAQNEGYRNESFESLEAAVLETQRGRWFLEEYARRQRSAETLAILEILKKLENSITNSSFLPPSKSLEPAPALKTEQLKFFKQDEEIFVEPTIAAPALSVVSSPPKVDITPPPEPKGAKLKIQRMPSSAIPEFIAAEPEKPAPTVPVEEPKASFAPQPAAEPKQRVVIIRRPASEAAEIPLMEEKSSEAAA